MLGKLLHRGPSASAVYADDRAILGARCPRTNRGPPIAMGDGAAAASDSYLFNKEFLRRTIVPGTDPGLSDAELFLKMYKTIGLRAFTYVDGAYAVAIVDKNRTILARDPYGIKPLYISSGKGPVAYSSEMKSQVLAGGRFIPFSPGACLVSGESVKRIVRREIPWAEDATPKTQEERLKCLFTRSVTGALFESNGANVILNGSVDSSALAAMSCKLMKKGVATASAGLEDSDELAISHKVSEHLGVDHRERVFDAEDMLELLDEAVYLAETYDYGTIRRCMPILMAARLFRNKSFVTLVSEGCDELFGGYGFLRSARGERKLRKMRVDLLNESHRTIFQGVDRMTSSVSLDCRMPFMSDEIVSFGLGLGPKDLFGPKRAHLKYILREAFDGLLPEQFVWKRHAKHGTAGLLAAEADGFISDRKFEFRTRLLGGRKVRTKEEMLYFETFRKHFPNASALAAVGFSSHPSSP